MGNLAAHGCPATWKRIPRLKEMNTHWFEWFLDISRYKFYLISTYHISLKMKHANTMLSRVCQEGMAQPYCSVSGGWRTTQEVDPPSNHKYLRSSSTETFVSRPSGILGPSRRPTSYPHIHPPSLWGLATFPRGAARPATPGTAVPVKYRYCLARSRDNDFTRITMSLLSFRKSLISFNLV